MAALNRKQLCQMSELEPVLKTAAEDLAENGEKAGKAVVDHIGNISGELKNAAGRYRNVDSEVEQKAQSVMSEAASGGEGKVPKLGSEGGGSGGGSKIDSILGGDKGAGGSGDRWPESGPMRDDQKQGVGDALKRLKVQPKDSDKIMAGLAGKKSPMGADAADIIGKGHLENGDGYSDVLSQFKSANTRPAAMMSLQHGDDLSKMGQQDVLFEMKEQPGQQHFDIDVGTRDGDGNLTSGYQLKDVSSVSAVQGASRKAASQLQHAPTDLKVALMDVHGPSSDLTDGIKQSLAAQAEHTGVTFHLRFSDGNDLTVPPGAAVYPGQ